jgi:importin subunit alpha-1
MPPVHVAIEAGVVTLLVDCLAFGSSEEQLFEAAWCLTNIASGDLQQTRAVEPALPLLILHLGGYLSYSLQGQAKAGLSFAEKDVC